LRSGCRCCRSGFFRVLARRIPTDRRGAGDPGTGIFFYNLVGGGAPGDDAHTNGGTPGARARGGGRGNYRELGDSPASRRGRQNRKSQETAGQGAPGVTGSPGPKRNRDFRRRELPGGSVGPSPLVTARRGDRAHLVSPNSHERVFFFFFCSAGSAPRQTRTVLGRKNPRGRPVSVAPQTPKKPGLGLRLERVGGFLFCATISGSTSAVQLQIFFFRGAARDPTAGRGVCAGVGGTQAAQARGAGPKGGIWEGAHPWGQALEMRPIQWGKIWPGGLWGGT